MEQFSQMLEANKNLAKDTPGKFELRKVERDSAGQERYIKTPEDEAIYQAKIQQMGVDAANQLQGSTYEERCSWIRDKKESGNALFK